MVQLVSWLSQGMVRGFIFDRSFSKREKKTKKKGKEKGEKQEINQIFSAKIFACASMWRQVCLLAMLLFTPVDAMIGDTNEKTTQSTSRTPTGQPAAHRETGVRLRKKKTHGNKLSRPQRTARQYPLHAHRVYGAGATEPMLKCGLFHQSLSSSPGKIVCISSCTQRHFFSWKRVWLIVSLQPFCPSMLIQLLVLLCYFSVVRSAKKPGAKIVTLSHTCARQEHRRNAQHEKEFSNEFGHRTSGKKLTWPT